MNKETENVNDWELFSELFENPIHLLQIHMVPPFADENSPMFYLQLNGKAVWDREKCVGIQGQCLSYFKRVICSRACWATTIESIRRFRHKMQDTTDGNKRTIVNRDPAVTNTTTKQN